MRTPTPRTTLTSQLTMWTAAAVLTLAVTAASAQSQSRGAAGLHAQLQYATPIARDVACRGFGPHCPPGTTWRCGPYRCWCARCY